jgi:hypothetical protein
MRWIVAALSIGIASPGASRAQNHENCPMAAKGHRHAVDHRHDEATGVSHEASQHHFALTPGGGSIRLEAKAPGDLASRDRIREHLRAIARAFPSGDFSMPWRIHDQAPPGADVMAARKAAIRYSYAPTERGGVVTISTSDKTALEAIHRFLRFQISDHGTGDPAE